MIQINLRLPVISHQHQNSDFDSYRAQIELSIIELNSCKTCNPQTTEIDVGVEFNHEENFCV